MMAGRIASQRLWSLAVMFAVSTGQVMLMSHASYGPAGDLISSQCRNKSEGKLERNDFATVFRLESPECVLYEQIVVFAIARSRRERDRTRDSEISFCRNRLVGQIHFAGSKSDNRATIRGGRGNTPAPPPSNEPRAPAACKSLPGAPCVHRIANSGRARRAAAA